MTLPCSVIQDLLPLYAEGLASPESAALVEEHLAGCAACREKLAALRQPEPSPPESAEPLKKLKKGLARRRWRTAAMAALAVFLLLFAVLARMTQETLLDYAPQILSAEGLTDWDGESELGFPASVSRFSPPGWEPSQPGKALVLHRSEKVTGVASEYYLDEDTGELTVYLQCWSNALGLVPGGAFPLSFLESGTLQDVIWPAPDRVIYGFGSRQALLWGEPMDGGAQILPRLVLAYYALIAAALALILGPAWLLGRKSRAAGLLRQLFFAPVSWLLGQALVKGTETLSFFLSRDLLLIGLEALAAYALLSLLAAARREARG